MVSTPSRETTTTCCTDDETGTGIAVDADGNVIVSGNFLATADFGGGNITVAGQTDGFIAKYSSEVPTAVRPHPVTSLELSAYPNPFNPSATIQFVLPGRGRVRIDIHDVHGALVTRIIDSVGDAGPNEVRWDGRDAHGRSVASAVYLGRMEFRGEMRTTKLFLMK